ncbi:flagellar hook-length control protein FliK [Phaeobacter sp. 22II1-1F12B]|uniref:flagellar hook-length control protein FliK n=1 Tax=Phaeobacter sp. 22II1-1F12B TaxID=1317111 RepID=UPI000B525580|nr:flagellar hook-length control protein FliK [Phaeobacter sp. 22II1-1F12B]
MSDPVTHPLLKHSLHANEGATTAPNQRSRQHNDTVKSNRNRANGKSFDQLIKDKFSCCRSPSRPKTIKHLSDNEQLWGDVYYALDTKTLDRESLNPLGAHPTTSACELGTPDHEPKNGTEDEVKNLAQNSADASFYQIPSRSDLVAGDGSNSASESGALSENFQIISSCENDLSRNGLTATRLDQEKSGSVPEPLTAPELLVRTLSNQVGSIRNHLEHGTSLFGPGVGQGHLDIDLLERKGLTSSQFVQQVKPEAELTGLREQVSFSFSGQSDLKWAPPGIRAANFSIVIPERVTEPQGSALAHHDAPELFASSTNDVSRRTQTLEPIMNNTHGFLHTGPLSAVTQTHAQGFFQQSTFDSLEADKFEARSLSIDDIVRSEKSSPDLSHATNGSSYNRSEYSGRISNNFVYFRSPQIPTENITLEQISDYFADRKNKVLELQLNPVELGRVHIRLVASNLGTVLSFEADRAETLEMMRENSSHLREEFERSGYPEITFDFDNKSRDMDQIEAPIETQAEAPSLHRNTSAESDVFNGLDIRI